MHALVLCFVVFSSSIVSASASASAASAAAASSYEWSNFPACKGIAQSPLNLPDISTFWDPQAKDIEVNILGGAEWNENVPERMSAYHNGTTLEIDTPGNLGTLQMTSGDTSTIYMLDNIHLHTPSEHTMNNVRFPLEMHLEHVTTDATGYEIKATLSLLFVGTNESDPRLFVEADSFLNSFALISAYPDTDASITMNLRLFGEEMERLRWEHYYGSLTVPPCTEDVQWVVSEPVYVSQSIIDWIRKDMEAMVPRAAQELNGRKIRMSTVMTTLDFNMKIARASTKKRIVVSLGVGTVLIIGIAAAIIIIRRIKIKRFRAKLRGHKAGEKIKLVEMTDLDV